MNTNPQIFHGEWWVPAVADYDTRMVFLEPEQVMGHEKKYTGTLTYSGDKDSTLELYHVPSNFHSRHYKYNNVMWGKDANGHIFTLFDVKMEESNWEDLSERKFTVSLILIGEHVLSLEENKYSRCIATYPYLTNWGFYETKDTVNFSFDSEIALLEVPYKSVCIFDAPIDDSSDWLLKQGYHILQNIQGYKITPSPFFEIRTKKPTHISSFINQIKEFSQFLSIALYGTQTPDTIKFVCEGKNNVRELLFTKNSISHDPGFKSLISLRLLKSRLPSMLKIWHENFDRIAPISSYLIDSLHKKNRFDVPDFLIIAQALDGYHKRFVNKKNGKDHQKYEDGIRMLLKQFEDVECIQKSHINPIILKDSRHFYSHLSPDEEKKSAVEGKDLYWLTEKCKILLTCCILNMLGLTNKEINLCCENSPISQIIDSFPPEIE